MRPAKPGYAAIQIAPRTAGLTHASGRVPLTRLTGAAAPQFVDVAWKIEGRRIELAARTPEGISSEIVLPDGTRKRFERGGECKLEAAV